MKFLKWNPVVTTLDHTTLTAYAPYAAGSWSPVLLQAQDVTGKHYFEVQHLSGSYLKIGLHNRDSSNYWYLDDFRGGSASVPSCTRLTVPTYALNARIMVAYDLDAGKIWFGVNGTWFASGNPASDSNPTMSAITVFGISNPVFPAVEMYGGGSLSARFYPYAADWLYAPAGFSEATEFDVGGRVMNTPLRRDMKDGGPYSIQGTITEREVPGRYRVRLHDQRTGQLIRETWSDLSGAYVFTHIDSKAKYLVAFDHTSPVQYAAVQDNVVAS